MDEYFLDPERLKLLDMRTKEELKRTVNKSFFRSTAQKKAARDKAYTGFLGQKVERAKLDIETRFKNEDVEVTLLIVQELLIHSLATCSTPLVPSSLTTSNHVHPI